MDPPSTTTGTLRASMAPLGGIGSWNDLGLFRRGSLDLSQDLMKPSLSRTQASGRVCTPQADGHMDLHFHKFASAPG